MPWNTASYTPFTSMKSKSYHHGHNHGGQQNPTGWEKHESPRVKRRSRDFLFPCIRRRKQPLECEPGVPSVRRGHPTAQPGEGGAPPDYSHAIPHGDGAPAQRPWDDDLAVQLTESIDSMFAQSPLSHQVDPGRDLADYDFIYDVVIHADGGGKIRRRLVVDFQTDVNVMSDRVYRRLHLKASAYDEAQSIRLPGRGDVTPLGTVAVHWSLLGDNRVYETRFYVVRGWHMDLVLGRPSVKEHQLYRKDAGVVSRLNTSYQR